MDHSPATGFNSGSHSTLPRDIPEPVLSWTGPRGGGFRYQQQQHLAGLLPHGPKGTRPLGLQPDVTLAVSRAGDALVGLGEGEKEKEARREWGSEKQGLGRKELEEGSGMGRKRWTSGSG